MRIVAHLARLNLRKLEQNADDEGDVVRIRNAIVVFVDELDDITIGDELIEKGSKEFGARETVRESNVGS